jgi:DNA-binding CsgD family transcriptional regulator
VGARGLRVRSEKEVPGVGAPQWGLVAELHGLIDRGDPRFVMLAPLEGVDAVLADVEAAVRRSMWNMQRHASVVSLRGLDTLNGRSARRGIEMRYVLPPHVAHRRCPLVSSRYPYLRLAHVAHPMIVVDHRLVLLGNTAGDALHGTTDAALVERAVALYDEVWQAAQPAVPEGTEPPFTSRMVEIGLLLVDGATDREIARALGVSERTVSADIHEMSRRLGARSRAHAIALIAGVDG